MCELCGRTIKTTEHHLVPKERKKHEDGFGAIAQLCRDCHRKLHATWDNKVLAKDYNTIDKLKAASELQSYLKWIRKQPSTVYFGSKKKGL